MGDLSRFETLRKGIELGEGRVRFLVPFFHIKVPFLANIECCPKFLEYALSILTNKVKC